MQKKKLTFASFSISLFLFPLAVYPANISVVSREPISLARILDGECTIVLEGPIERGDVQKMSFLWDEDEIVGYANHSLDFEHYGEIRKHALCLDSPGGSYSDAIFFIENFISPGMITSIPEGAKCLSSCALVFLAGRLGVSNSSGGAATPFRVMHISSSLGFHSPYSSYIHRLNEVPDEARVEAAAIAYRSAMFVIAELHSVFSNSRISFEAGGGRLPIELLLETLKRGKKNEYYFIDTVDKAGAYGIRLSGAPEPEIDPGAFFTACSNLVQWASGKTFDSYVPDLSSWGYSLAGTFNGSETYLRDELVTGGAQAIDLDGGEDELIDFTVESRHEICEFFASENDGFPYYASFNYNEQSSGNFGRPVQTWFFYPHYVTLESLTELAASGSKYRLESSYGDSGHPYLGASVVSDFSSGYSYVLRAPYPYQYWAMYLGDDSVVKIYSETGGVTEHSYVLSDGGLCLENYRFIVDDECYYLQNVASDVGAAETIVLRSHDGTNHKVVFSRLGDVGPVPPVPKR